LGNVGYDIVFKDVVDGSTVIDLATAKMNSKIADSAEDTLLQILLDASVQEAEDYISNPILKRDLDIRLTGWVSPFTIPVFPVQSVVELTYYDQGGQEQILEASNYRVNGDQLIIKMESLPELEEGNMFPVTIKCVGGYDNDKMPKQIVSAVLLRFSHKELFREDMPTSYERSFHAALRPLKRWS
jgi:uncharacterized phiE125 gp8 family phage protein